MDRRERSIRRLRRAKIAMVWVTVALGVAIGVSAFYEVGIGALTTTSGRPRVVISVYRGLAGVAVNSAGYHPVYAGARLTLNQVRSPLMLRLLPILSPGSSPLRLAIGVPLIYPFVLSTALFWRFGRSEKRIARLGGACQTCGYDLRGSAGTVCPECGSAKMAENPRAEVRGSGGDSA